MGPSDDDADAQLLYLSWLRWLQDHIKWPSAENVCAPLTKTKISSLYDTTVTKSFILKQEKQSCAEVAQSKCTISVHIFLSTETVCSKVNMHRPGPNGSRSAGDYHKIASITLTVNMFKNRVDKTWRDMGIYS